MDTPDNEYEYFLYPHVNGTCTGIIVFVPVDIRTHEYSYPLYSNLN